MRPAPLPGMSATPLSEVATDRLTLLLESTGEGIFGIDMAARCTFVNRAAALMIGLRTALVLGRNMHELALLAVRQSLL